MPCLCLARRVNERRRSLRNDQRTLGRPHLHDLRRPAFRMAARRGHGAAQPRGHRPARKRTKTGKRELSGAGSFGGRAAPREADMKIANTMANSICDFRRWRRGPMIAFAFGRWSACLLLILAPPFLAAQTPIDEDAPWPRVRSTNGNTVT